MSALDRITELLAYEHGDTCTDFSCLCDPFDVVAQGSMFRREARRLIQQAVAEEDDLL